jgi:hypothetical protein
VRRIRSDRGVPLRGDDTVLRDRRRVVAVDQVVRDARVIRMLRELRLEDRRGLEIGA